MKASLHPVVAALASGSALTLTLLAADRIIGGPRGPVGWRPVADLQAFDEPPWIPSYLPPKLRWPPAQLLLHPSPTGWWIRLDDADGPAVWIGAGEVAPPDDLGPPAACLEGRTRCPHGWRLRTSHRAGRPDVHVLTRLRGVEASRMRRTLAPYRK